MNKQNLRTRIKINGAKTVILYEITVFLQLITPIVMQMNFFILIHTVTCILGIRNYFYNVSNIIIQIFGYIYLKLNNLQILLFHFNCNGDKSDHAS